MKRLIVLLVLLSMVFASCSFGLQGDNGVTVSGDESTSEVTIGLDGSVLRGALADSGNATGSGSWLTIAGAGNVTTSASGSTVVITCVSGSGSPDMSLTEGHLFIGNSSGLAEDMALSGDATLNGLGEIHVAWADESQTADAANSATDSDKLDGLHGSSYLLGNATAVDSNLFAGLSAAQWATLIDTYALADIDTMDFTGDTGTASPASQVVHVVGSGSVSTSASGHTVTITGNTTAADSDKLDGQEGSYYLTDASTSIKGISVYASADFGVSSGNVTLANAESVRASLSVDQTLTKLTWSPINFDTEQFDTDTMHNNVINPSRFVCKVAGTYVMVGVIVYYSNAVGLRYIQMRGNGGTFYAAPNIQVLAVSGDATVLQSLSMYVLAVNDYIELLGYQASAGDLKVYGTSPWVTSFCMYKVR